MYTNSQIDIALTIIERDALMPNDFDDIELLRVMIENENESYDETIVYELIDCANELYDAIESREYSYSQFTRTFHDFIFNIKRLD